MPEQCENASVKSVTATFVLNKVAGIEIKYQQLLNTFVKLVTAIFALNKLVGIKLKYIQPSKAHLPVEKYYTIEEFEQLKTLAKKIRTV